MSGAAGKWRGMLRGVGWIAIVFILQIGFIVWLSDNSKAPARRFSPAPTLSMVSPQSSELMALNDPTLFALPHYRSFSGPAWMRARAMPAHVFEWTDQPSWFGPGTNDFAKSEAIRDPGLEVYELVKTELPSPPTPDMSLPSQFRQRSTLRLFGFARKPLSIPPLPGWSSTNLLTNTVVRLMVDASGITRSQTLLVRSGLAEADEYALNLSRNLRFEPTAAPLGSSNPMSGAMWGQAIFQWQNSPNPVGGKK